MRVTARWEFLDQPASNCSQCGHALIPHLPRCPNCATPAARASRELSFEPHLFAKPEHAIRVVHLSDLHVGQPMPEERIKPMAVFRIWLERLLDVEVDVLVISGDLVERPGDSYGMARVHALLHDCPMSWMVVPGNHDIQRPGYHDPFNDIYGDYPRIETHHGIDFILFDSMKGLPLEEREVAERMYGDYVCYTEGRIGTPQFAAIEEELLARPERPRAIVLHHHVMRQHADLMPLVPKQTAITEDIFGTMKALMDADRLFDWAVEHNVKTIYHGHKHLFQQPGIRANNVLILNAGSSTLREGAQFGRIIDYLPDRRIVSNITLTL